MKGFLDIPVWMKMLIELQDKELCISDISFSTQTTYSHVNKIIKELDYNGMINVRKEGRSKFIKLNKKGIDAAKASELLSKEKR